VAQGLSWIDNLQTSKKGGCPLDDPRHPDHQKLYVNLIWSGSEPGNAKPTPSLPDPMPGENYVAVQSFAISTRTVSVEYERRLGEAREELRQEIRRQLDEGALS
jgi:hypothetical protein